MPITLAGLAPPRIAQPPVVASLVGSALAVAIMTLVMTPALDAQPKQAVGTMGTVRGTVYDSLSMRPLADAVVEVQETAQLAYTDRDGRFTIDSVPLGAQQLTFSAPALDSLGLYGFARTIEVRSNTRDVQLATPSFHTIFGRLCPSMDRPSGDSAIVFGTVYDAASRAPIPGAVVALRWFETDDQSTGLQIRTPQRTASTGADGVYGICGVPADLALSTSAVHDSTSSGVFSTVVGPSRMLRRDLYLSRELGAVASASENATPAHGTGIVHGTVRDERGNALVGALLVLTTVDRTTHTDSTGRYRFTGVPLGTQEVSVRQLGRGALYRIIDVTANEGNTHDFILPQTTVLAAMNVRGRAMAGADEAGYLQRKRLGQGRFLEREEILKRPSAAAALARMPGLRVEETADGVSIKPTREFCTGMGLIIDGAMQRGNEAFKRIEALPVDQIHAIEYYPSPVGVPIDLWQGTPPGCGVILIWTTFARWSR